MNKLLKHALLCTTLAAAALLGGCYVAPYPYYGRPAVYAPPPVVIAPGYYRPYYRY